MEYVSTACALLEFSEVHSLNLETMAFLNFKAAKHLNNCSCSIPFGRGGEPVS